MTVSIGYASSETVSADGLVDLADASLYRAKQDGRNRCASLTPADAFPALADGTGRTDTGPPTGPGRLSPCRSVE